MLILEEILGVSSQMDLLAEKLVEYIAFHTIEKFYNFFQMVVRADSGQI